jgi:hypothetical protein
MTFDAVHTVWDYFDGPRTGLADYRGLPHYFVCKFDTAADDYSDLFTLALVDDETLALALKQWAIWREWEVAFHTGAVTQGSHPGIKGNKATYAAYEAELQERLGKLQCLQYSVRATFHANPGVAQMSPGMMRPFEVSWQDVNKQA